MIKILFVLFFIDCFHTQYVLSQYSNNEGFNRMEYPKDSNDYSRDLSNDYSITTRNQFDGYNQPKGLSYQSEYKNVLQEMSYQPYDFEYNIDDGYGNKQDRQEKADENGNVIGSYGYIDSNGIYRRVDYTAGAQGFVAKINSNEPFLKKNANPSHVTLFVEDPPLNPINYGKQKNNYLRDEPINDKYDDSINGQMREQVYRTADNQNSSSNKRYVESGFERVRPLLSMINPQYNGRRNTNQNSYNPIDSFGRTQNRNIDEIQAYASNRRYYD